MKRILVYALSSFSLLLPCSAQVQQNIPNELGIVKGLSHQQETLYDIKAIKNDGTQYNVNVIIDKSCDGSRDICIHSVRAFIDGKETPVKVVSEENGARLTIKAITGKGELVDIKGIDKAGKLVDLKVFYKPGSQAHNIKLVHQDGTITATKGFDKNGEIYHIKALTISEGGTRTVNGVDYFGDVKAISIH